MFRNTYQGGLLSILYSCGSSPLELWDMHVKNGYIRRITDEEIKSLALEIAGTNVATTYIYCPPNPKKALGIKLPFLVIIIKNMKKYFTFEITVKKDSCEYILDDKDMHRRFRVSNFQSTTRVRPFCTSMPIGLSDGWNQIQFNLCDFTRRAYGTNYIETTRMQIHANCRLRRVYFADRLYSEDEISEEFKLFFPIHRKKCVREERVPEKPKVEKVPPVITKEPIIETEVQVEEMIEPPIIPKEPIITDLIEEAVPEKIITEEEKVKMERDEEEEEEEEEEREKEKEEEEGEKEEEEVEIKKEEVEIKEEEVEIKKEEAEEEAEIFDEEEQTELTDAIYEDEDEERAIDTSRLEQDYMEDEMED